jgi:hypothetical protein
MNVSRFLSTTGRSRLGIPVLACLALALPSCESDGNFTLFGYTTKPNYNSCIHKVYVPMFKNLTFWRGIEFELTKAVVREIEAKTPYKVVSCAADADTELTGTIISFNKDILNRNQLNEVREAQTTLAVQVVWRDLHTGEILSQPKPPGGVVPIVPAVPAPPTPGTTAPIPLPAGPVAAPVPPPPPGPPPVLVQSIGGFIPELGQSLTTAQKENVDRLAIQIVSMMETPW